MKKLLMLVLFCLIPSWSHALNLVDNAKIVKIGSSNWNKKAFYVVLSGGTGPCANLSVSFPEEFSQSTVAYAQSQALALTAFIHNKTVSIHNYGNKEFVEGNICTGGSLIEISN